MSSNATTGSPTRRDVIWQQGGAVANYLGRSRQAIPLASEQVDAMLRVIAAFDCPTRTVLDIGAGDGALAEAVVRRFHVDRVALVDFSPPMLEQARERFDGAPMAVEIIDADLRDTRWMHGLPPEIESYDLIVSRYAIHHLPHARKRELYAELHSRLSPGGLFVNIEHVSSVSPVFTSIFEGLIIDGMVATSDGSLDLDAATVAFRARQDAETNILAPVEDQCAWLREIGFVDVDVVMKVFELAVIVARRPNV